MWGSVEKPAEGVSAKVLRSAIRVHARDTVNGGAGEIPSAGLRESGKIVYDWGIDIPNSIGYQRLETMKTDISIPNPIFKSTQRLAEKLGISLSELYAAALFEYVTTHENVTEALNQIYEVESSEMEPELVQIQMASLDGENW